MSLPRPSGIKTPAGSKLARPAVKSGLMPPGSLSRAQSAIAKSARAAGLNSNIADKYAAETVHVLSGEDELSTPSSVVDDFIIGNRVYVSGSKPGYIAFLGETQFAPGEWAGVVLDETIGKNDGTVNGVKYFQCEPKRGVFCRINKLSRTPMNIMSTSQSEDAGSETSLPQNGSNAPVRRPTTPSVLPRPMTPSHHRATTPTNVPRPVTPSIPRPVHKSLSSSNTSLNKGPAPAMVKSESHVAPMAPPAAGGLKFSLKLGDRVLVSGSKLGTLRYIGPADFAKGQWSGVELDDAVGKNDGAVAGKRYFDCPPRYGLFAPLHKVTKLTAAATPTGQPRNTGLRLTREKSGSQESVSSLSSVTSSASRPRVRLGVTALHSNQTKTGARPGSLNITATTTALQKALKEKEEHIEQLLRERDLERSEVGRAAAQVDEAQGQLTHMRTEKDRFQEETDESIHQLRTRVHKLEKEKHDLVEKLDDEKRKVEDLQFQIEEEVINKDDLESRTEEEEAKIRNLEKSLRKQTEKCEKFETHFLTLKSVTDRQKEELKSMEETQTTYLDQVEELTHKLSQAESRVQTYESSRLEEGAKTSQVGLELAEKVSQISQLEDFLSLRSKEVQQLQEKLLELNDEVISKTSKQEKLQKDVDELTQKFSASDKASNEKATQLQKYKSASSELQRQLESTKKQSEQLSEEKSQMERQVGEMMKNSGDFSQQLSMLNEQLGQKNRKVETLQADLSTSTQKWHNLNNKLEEVGRAREREMELLMSKYKKIVENVQAKLEDVNRELDRTKMKVHTMESDFDKEKELLLKRKDTEITELKQQLETSAENLSRQEVQTQAHKQFLDKITMEKDALQFEKEKLEKQMKRLETDREHLNSELIQAKVGMTKSQTASEQTARTHKALEDKIQDLHEDVARLGKVNSESNKLKEELHADKDRLTSERDQFQRELMEGRATIQQRAMQVDELHIQVEKLKVENSQQQESLSKLSEKSSESGALQGQLTEQFSLTEGLRKQLTEQQRISQVLKKRLEAQDSDMKTLKIEVEEGQETVGLLEETVKELELEKSDLLAQLSSSQDMIDEKAKLERQNQQLVHKLEMAKQSHSQELDAVNTDKAGLQLQLDNATSVLLQRERDLKAKSSQISNLENENRMLGKYKSANEQLERDVVELRDKVNKQQTKLAAVEINANVINNKDTSSNVLVKKLREEKESTEHQMTFLNSVIVDLQHKNGELKTRLEAMEHGIVNGATDDSMDLSSPSRRAAPRVFCDICDVFDRHETEDCPLQEMSDSPPPSQFHGDRNQVRPYCDICEEFHAPCGGAKKKIAEGGRDPSVDRIKDWMKTVDELSTDLASEAKAFGEDGEFFHVQRDPTELPCFRDSGYYDGPLDARSPTDPKSKGLIDSLIAREKGIRDVAEISEKEKAQMIHEILKTNTKCKKELDTVELYDDEPIFVPGLDKCFTPTLQKDFLETLNSTKQGTDSMEERVKQISNEAAKNIDAVVKNTCSEAESVDIKSADNGSDEIVEEANLKTEVRPTELLSSDDTIKADTLKKNGLHIAPLNLNSVGKNLKPGEYTSDTMMNKDDAIMNKDDNTLINEVDADKPDAGKNEVESPCSPTGGPVSSSDSEYQSGKESLGSESEMPTDLLTPGSESSVDSGEVFTDGGNTQDIPKPDGDNSAENCVVS